MPSVLAIISKAVFEKMASKGVKPGALVDTNRYLSKVKALDVLTGADALFLVTVRPPDERLWLAAILESPAFKRDGWYGAPNQTPIADVTAAIPRLAFASGLGLKPKKGALGMSLQTPRVLTSNDEDVLRGLTTPAGKAKGRARAPDAYAAAVAATPKGKDAAAYASEAARQVGLRPLRFENHRRRDTWAAFSAAEKKQLKAFEAGFREQEEWGGFEIVDGVDATRGTVRYLFVTWPFGSAVLLKAGTCEVLGEAAQHGFALRTPDAMLRKSLAAAYADARKTIGKLESLDFRPTTAELQAAGPSTASSKELLAAVDKLKWKEVEQEHAATIGGLLRLWGKDAKATGRLKSLLTNDTLAGQTPTCGKVAGLVLTACSTRKLANAGDLNSEEREVLEVIAGHPKALRFGVGHASGKHQWPTTALELRRWLGTKPPPCLDLKLQSGETIAEALTAATRGVGSLERVAMQVAAAVAGERVLDLVIDIFGTSHTFTNVADLKIDHGKLSPEGRRLKDLEIARRSARLLEFVRRLLAGSLDLPTVVSAIEAGGHDGAAMAALLLAADTLAVGKKLGLPVGLEKELANAAAVPDFVEPVRHLLGPCSESERGRFLAQLQCDIAHDNPSAWLYLDLLSPREATLIAKSYNLLPNEELTPQYLKRVSKAEGARVISILAKQYGATVEQRAGQIGTVVEFTGPGGKPVPLWASARFGTLLDRAPWKPSAAERES